MKVTDLAASPDGGVSGIPAGYLVEAHPSTVASRLPDTDLVEVTEEIGWVVVDAVRAGPLELFEAVATRQQADAE